MRYEIKLAEDPYISIIVPFTRLWCVEPFFKRLRELYLNRPYTELIFWVDTSEDDLFNKVCLEAEKLKDFNGVRVLWARNGIHENDSVYDCRKRIVALHEELKVEISGKLVVGLEDDTIVPVNAVERLTILINKENVGFVQGIEVGRRGYRVFGSWEVKSRNGTTTVATQPLLSGLQEIDGGGLYCFITKAELYKDHNFSSANSGYEFFGPDFNFVFSVTRKGYDAFTDWSLPCEHLYLLDGEVKKLTVDNGVQVATWTRKKGENLWSQKVVTNK